MFTKFKNFCTGVKDAVVRYTRSGIRVANCIGDTIAKSVAAFTVGVVSYLIELINNIIATLCALYELACECGVQETADDWYRTNLNVLDDSISNFREEAVHAKEIFAGWWRSLVSKANRLIEWVKSLNTASTKQMLGFIGNLLMVTSLMTVTYLAVIFALVFALVAASASLGGPTIVLVVVAGFIASSVVLRKYGPAVLRESTLSRVLFSLGFGFALLAIIPATFVATSYVLLNVWLLMMTLTFATFVAAKLIDQAFDKGFLQLNNPLRLFAKRQDAVVIDAKAQTRGASGTAAVKRAGLVESLLSKPSTIQG